MIQKFGLIREYFIDLLTLLLFYPHCLWCWVRRLLRLGIWMPSPLNCGKWSSFHIPSYLPQLRHLVTDTLIKNNYDMFERAWKTYSTPYVPFCETGQVLVRLLVAYQCSLMCVSIIVRIKHSEGQVQCIQYGSRVTHGL